MTRITLRAKSDGTEISGELAQEGDAFWSVSPARQTREVTLYKDEWDRVHALPTTPGTVFRATVGGVPNVRVVATGAGAPDDQAYYTPEPTGGHFWHRAEHIDASTVREELEGDE